MAGKWKVGDMVQLKTGGPEMTVAGADAKDPDKVACDWFDSKGTAKSKSFHEDQLVEYDPDEEPPAISMG
jgi:uncharacterized protein YodC (DUF2158 family)